MAIDSIDHGSSFCFYGERVVQSMTVSNHSVPDFLTKKESSQIFVRSFLFTILSQLQFHALPVSSTCLFFIVINLPKKVALYRVFLS